MNKSFLSGNLTREPELVAINGSEFSLIKFGIANNDERKKNAQTGEWENIVSYFDMEYWTKNPTLWLQKLKKGAGVECESHEKQDRWEQDGNKRSKVVHVLDRFPSMLERQGGSTTDDPSVEPKDPPF